MIKLRKSRFRPKFKSFNNNKILISYRNKLLSFKKKKWSKLRSRLSKITLTRKYNCYYKFYGCDMKARGHYKDEKKHRLRRGESLSQFNKQPTAM